MRSVPLLVLALLALTVTCRADQLSDFVNLTWKTKQAYMQGNTELQRTYIRGLRKQGLCLYVTDRAVSNWYGEVIQVLSNSDGRAGLKVRLSQDTTLTTFAMMDFEHTMVSPSEPMYKTLLGINKGDRVVFDGTFFKSDRDCLLELSLTEAGSMTEPEFLFRFTKLQRY